MRFGSWGKGSSIACAHAHQRPPGYFSFVEFSPFQRGKSGASTRLDCHRRTLPSRLWEHFGSPLTAPYSCRLRPAKGFDRYAPPPFRFSSRCKAVAYSPVRSAKSAWATTRLLYWTCRPSPPFQRASPRRRCTCRWHLGTWRHLDRLVDRLRDGVEWHPAPLSPLRALSTRPAAALSGRLRPAVSALRLPPPDWICTRPAGL